MENQDFKLEPETQPVAPRKHTGRNVALIALLALTLVLGAFYAPLLISSASVAAAPSLQQAVSLPDVPAVTGNLQENQQTLAQLYDAIAPSVVSIEVAGLPTTQGFQIGGIPQDQLPQLPQLPGDNGSNGDQLLPQGQGSGWIYDDQGHFHEDINVFGNNPADPTRKQACATRTSTVA